MNYDRTGEWWVVRHLALTSTLNLSSNRNENRQTFHNRFFIGFDSVADEPTIFSLSSMFDARSKIIIICCIQRFDIFGMWNNDEPIFNWNIYFFCCCQKWCVIDVSTKVLPNVYQSEESEDNVSLQKLLQIMVNEDGNRCIWGKMWWAPWHVGYSGFCFIIITLLHVTCDT